MECLHFIEPGDSDNGPAVFAANFRKARKEHRCVECRRAIGAGTVYLEESGLWGGGFDTFRVCPDCLSARNSFMPTGGIYGALWENIREHIGESRGDIGSAHITCLSAVARDRVCDMIEGTWIEN